MTPLEPIATKARTDAERLIAEAASIAPREVDPRAFDDLVARAALHRPGAWRLVPAFALAAAVGAVLVLAWPTARAPLPVQLVASSDAAWKQRDGVVTLQTGRLSVARAGASVVRIETPHVSLEARNSRFLAEVIASGTSLIVEEGEVVLRAGSMTRVVKAGESVVWPPTPEIPSALLETTAPAAEKCSDAPAASHRDCLVGEAQGSSLDAQAALFELGALESREGRLARALDAWNTSLRRFPDGVLHPEVRLRRLVLLVQARRFSEAQLAAEEFERACPEDPRLADVRALRAALRR